MNKYVVSLFSLIAIAALSLSSSNPARASSNLSPSADTVIGSGTAASCQSASAASNLSNAVAAGGKITFNCGPSPVVINANTNATDQIVTIDGGGLVTLDGQNNLQLFFLFGSAHLTLKNISLVDGNFSSGGAIGISTPQAKVDIYNSFLTSNESGLSNGGAINNKGSLGVYNSTLGSNISLASGGGIYNDGGTVTIVNSTLISNQSANGGAIYSNGGTLTVRKSAIRSNIASANGGGFYVNTSTNAIVNTTFYDNKALGGGGIYFAGNTLNLTNNTFSANRADTGGAIWNFNGIASVKNTILANSLTTNGATGSLNCDGSSMTSLGRNIVSDNSCLPNPSSMGDLFSTDPLLSAFLDFNGGDTKNFFPQPGSPAIDYALDCPTEDQRGVPRPSGPNCDVGSVETLWPAFIPFLGN